MSIAQNPLLDVEVTLPREDVALISVGGYLDVDTATEFQHHLANQLHHGRLHFLLDLSAVPFMDSSGMNIILRVYQEVREKGGTVQVIAPTSAVRRILDLTGVSITVPISETADEALAGVDTLAERADEGGLPGQEEAARARESGDAGGGTGTV